MATLRDLGLDPTAPAARPATTTLRNLGLVGSTSPDDNQFQDQALANGMGQLRRGFTSGLLGADANALATDMSAARVAGDAAKGDELAARIAAIKQRQGTFAPTEQDVTKLNWEPGRILDYGLGAVGQGTASMLEPAGAAAGLGAASRLVGAIPGPLAKGASQALRAGAWAAPGYLNYRQNKGEFINDAYDDPTTMRTKSAQDIDTAGSLHGVIGGAFDTALPGLIGERVAGRAGMKALGGLGVLPKTALDMAGEGVTEVLQGESKRYQLGRLNPERDATGDTADRWNDLAGGFLGAGPFSAASHLASKGHSRLGVADDKSSDDVSGKAGAPAPAREAVGDVLKRGAKGYADEEAARTWAETLRSGDPSIDPLAPGGEDAGFSSRHQALLKELDGRAAKGDATSQQHADVLRSMSPDSDAIDWYDPAPRDAAFEHLMQGDGSDLATVVKKYRDRRQNAQGQGKASDETQLAAGILQKALPQDAPGMTKGDGVFMAQAASALGETIASFAGAKGGPKGFTSSAKMREVATDMVALYGGLPGARAALAKVGTALGAEKSPAFVKLQQHLEGADKLAFKDNMRKSRLEAADQVFAAVPPKARLEMFGEGVDLTDPNMRMSLLDYVEQVAKKTGWGATDPAGQPLVVKPSAYAGLTAKLGADAAKAVLDLVAPGQVTEREDVGQSKASGGEKTAAATESDKIKTGQGLGEDAVEEGDDWALQGAMKNIDKAPGAKLYLAKGKGAVSSTDGQPFVPDKKTKNLPTLSALDDTNDGDGPAGSGPKTLDSMIAKAWLALGGQEFNDPVVKTERNGGVTRRTTKVPDPMAAVPSAPGRPGAPATYGVGSYRIRAASAREVMDTHSVAPEKRVELLKDYLARPGKKGAKAVLAKDDPTIQQLATLDRKIKIREKETPKEFTTGVSRDGSPLPTVDNPAYVELQDLKGQRKEVMAKLAAKIGVEVSEDATVPELANAYFDSRFLVTAEQMAEKDQLRLDVAEVRSMVRRGKDDLDFTDQFGKDKVEVQAGMNLIRFASKSAVSNDGIAVIRANDLVNWVRDNRNDKAPPKTNSPERAAVAFRNDLMEGIGALAADGHLGEMPYMLNEQGEKESFADGFPPTLRLSGLTQGALDVRKAERAERVKPFVGPPDVDAVAREQAEGSIDLDPAVRRDEDRTARQSEESDGAPNEFRNQGAERGAADSKYQTRLSAKELFWDAPELALTRTDRDNVVPSETEPREQRKGVPTERTDIAMRTATIDSALDGVDTLTMANAPAKATRMAEGLWAGLGRSHPDSSIKANPAAGWRNVLNTFATLRSGKLQYAAPLAHLLTPAHVKRLTETAKDPAKAAPMLRGLVGEVAAALAAMPDSGFSRAEKTVLARLLTGDEKLVASKVGGALRTMVPKAEPTATPTAKERVEALANAKKNAQATAPGATGVYSDAEVAKAEAHFAKVLGPQVNVIASEAFPDAGTWSDAEQTARLSTAIGPGVLSVAYHESMHGLWSRLIKNSPKAAEALSRVMSSPDMLARVSSLLADEPAALEAITTGPHAAEERVAYAYQFWAAGLLDVDKPATTMFAKFRKMLRKVLGTVRDSEVALDLMTAFHDGKLAEPSAAGRVIDGILKAQTWNEDVKRKFDKQVQSMHAAISPSNDVLRKEVLSATARKLGVAMFTNPGEEKVGGAGPGYINARNQKGRQYTNYLYDALKGLSERDMVAAINELQMEREPTTANVPYAPVRKAVEKVQALTQRYYQYATTEAGMQLEFAGKHHFPRVWDVNALVEGDGKDKFLAMLKQPKYAKFLNSAKDLANAAAGSALYTLDDIANQMYQTLVEKNGVDEKGIDGEMKNDILTPFFASQKERSFNWLDPADVKPFLEKDLVGAMSRYLHQGVRSAEYARRFGEGGAKLKEMLALKGDKWTDPETGRVGPRPDHGTIGSEIMASLKEKGIEGKDAEVIFARHMEDIKNSVMAHEGSLGKDISPTFRKFSSAAMAYQNLRLLPLSLFAAFGDSVGIAARYGDGGGKLAFQAFLQGLRDVYARWKDAVSDMPAARQKSVWEDIAEMVGAVDSHMFLEQMGKAHTSEFMTDFARKSNRALFMANGLTAWDRSMRVSGTKAAVLFIQHHAGLPDKAHSGRWLKELGLSAESVPLDADGKLITDRHALAASRMKGTETDAEKADVLALATKDMERIHHSIVRWVEGAVLTPSAGQRPTWASDPHYAVLFHLKQFTYSFHHTILKRAFNEASQGNMNPIGALAMAVPTMVAADMVKGLVVGGGSFPDYMKAWDAGDWMLHGMERAGHLGVAQFGVDALKDPTSLLGPTVDQVTDFILHPTDIAKNTLNAVPGLRMVGGLKDMARAVG